MLKGEFVDIEVLGDLLNSHVVWNARHQTLVDIFFAVSLPDELSNVSFFIVTFTYRISQNANPEVYVKFRVTFRLLDFQAPLNMHLLADLVFNGYDRIKATLKNNIKRFTFSEYEEVPDLTMHDFQERLVNMVAEVTALKS